MIPSSCSRRYLVSNDIMSAISKYNNCEISQSKITTLLINERHITHTLVGKYFYTHDSHLLDFDMDDVDLLRHWNIENAKFESFLWEKWDQERVFNS